MILANPVLDVGEDELARGLCARTVEVQRLAPIVSVAVGEVLGREARQIVAVRPEVVVDRVEDDSQATRVRGVDEGAHLVRPAVEPGRREPVHPVIAPAEVAREVGNRHQLNGRDAERPQPVETTGRARPGTLGRERADVQLVENLPFE